MNNSKRKGNQMTKFITLLICLLIFIHSSWSETISNIYDLAVQNDPVMKAARANLRVGEETKNISKSRLLPSLSSYADITESERNSSASQVYSFISAGKALSESAKAQFAADQQNLIIRVTNAYLSVLRAFDNNETRKAEQRAIFRQLEQTKERFEVGLLPITDVHEAQAIFDDALVNSLEAKGALAIAFDNLEVLTGERYDNLSGLSEKFNAENPTPLDANSWVTFSLENNFNIKVAKFGKDSSYNQAKAAAAELYPRLTASARYSDSETEGSQISYIPSLSSSNISSLSDGHSFNLSFTMPIWSYGLNASSRQAKQRSIASEQSYEAVKRSTAQSARAQHQLVITNAARVKARKQAITSAESALNATQAGYEVGTRNIVDLLSAQRALFQAKRNYANSKYDYIFAMMSLKEVAGQLSPQDIYQLNAWLDPKISVTR